MKPIRLSELIQALEFDSPDYMQLVDLEEGRVVLVEQCVLRKIEEGDDEGDSEISGWAKQAMEIAQAVAADESRDRFKRVPDKFEFHEHRQMERFIRTVADPDVADQLWRAIKGKGAFRHFKDTAHRLGLLDKWDRYRDGSMKKFVVDWAEAKKVPIVDDLQNRTG